MVISTEDGSGEPITRSGPYNGNGVTAVFDYDFQVQQEQELRVTRQNADLSESLLEAGVDFTISGLGDDAGGQVTIIDPATRLPSGTKLLLRYAGDYLQTVNYSNQGSVQLSLLEGTLDKLMMHLRGVSEQLDRTVQVDAFNVLDLDLLTANIAAIGLVQDEIVTVAGIATDVTNVADDATDIGTVSAAITSVNTVASISASVSTVAGIDADVSAVAADEADIGIVAANMADVNALAAGGTVNVTGLAIAGTPVTAAGTSLIGAVDAAAQRVVMGIPTYVNAEGVLSDDTGYSTSSTALVTFKTFLIPETFADSRLLVDFSLLSSLALSANGDVGAGYSIFCGDATGTAQVDGAQTLATTFQFVKTATDSASTRIIAQQCGLLPELPQAAKIDLALVGGAGTGWYIVMQQERVYSGGVTSSAIRLRYKELPNA